MAKERETAVKLIQALRRIEVDAEGALLHGGNLHKILESIRDAARNAAAEAASRRHAPSLLARIAGPSRSLGSGTCS
jgi:hypothetical protein